MIFDNVILEAEDHLYRARRARSVKEAENELRGLLDLLDQELNA